MQWIVLGGMLASWVMIYLCLFKGVKWVSKVVLITSDGHEVARWFGAAGEAELRKALDQLVAYG